MSLLDSTNEEITIYLQVTDTDSDGNIITRPSTDGIKTRAMIQLQAQSGTSARRAELDNEGFETEEVYRLRFPRKFSYVLEPQSRVEWNGQYWAVIGFAQRFNGSRRTRHTDYTIRRT